jgi:hypothetical protein
MEYGRNNVEVRADGIGLQNIGYQTCLPAGRYRIMNLEGVRVDTDHRLNIELAPWPI